MALLNPDRTKDYNLKMGYELIRNHPQACYYYRAYQSLSDDEKKEIDELVRIIMNHTTNVGPGNALWLIGRLGIFLVHGEARLSRKLKDPKRLYKAM